MSVSAGFAWCFCICAKCRTHDLRVFILKIWALHPAMRGKSSSRCRDPWIREPCKLHWNHIKSLNIWDARYTLAKHNFIELSVPIYVNTNFVHSLDSLRCIYNKLHILQNCLNKCKHGVWHGCSVAPPMAQNITIHLNLGSRFSFLDCTSRRGEATSAIRSNLAILHSDVAQKISTVLIQDWLWLTTTRAFTSRTLVKISWICHSSCCTPSTMCFSM